MSSGYGAGGAMPKRCASSQVSTSAVAVDASGSFSDSSPSSNFRTGIPASPPGPYPATAASSATLSIQEAKGWVRPSASTGSTSCTAGFRSAASSSSCGSVPSAGMSHAKIRVRGALKAAPPSSSLAMPLRSTLIAAPIPAAGPEKGGSSRVSTTVVSGSASMKASSSTRSSSG